MSAVESASVPSQSNASKRKRRGADRCTDVALLPNELEAESCMGATFFGIETCNESRQLRRHRRLNHKRVAGQRVNKPDSVRVQEHSFQSFFGERPVPGEIAVFVIAGQR